MTDRNIVIMPSVVRALPVGLLAFITGLLMLLTLSAAWYRNAEIQAIFNNGFQGMISALFLLLMIFFISFMVMWWGGLLVIAVLQHKPLVCFSAQGVKRLPLGLGCNKLDWDHVQAVQPRGLWIILVDGQVEQHRIVSALMGVKGVWIPALLAQGGSVEVLNAVKCFRPDL